MASINADLLLPSIDHVLAAPEAVLKRYYAHLEHLDPRLRYLLPATLPRYMQFALYRLQRTRAGALMSAMAGIAFATPASALEAPDPEGAGFYSSPAGGSGTSLTDDGWELAQVATGALGGLLVAGMGVAVVAGLRRHQGGAHPA